MKCRRCGATLKKQGDLCAKCYNEMKEEEELKNDVKPVLTVKRKYNPVYHLKQRWDIILIMLLAAVSLFSNGVIWGGLGTLALGIIIILVYLAWQKMLVLKEKIVFYEKKVVKYSEMPIFGGTREVSYKNLKDITYYQQTRRQKKANLGDLVIYVKYTGYFGGISMTNVENGAELIAQISELLPIEFEE